MPINVRSEALRSWGPAGIFAFAIIAAGALVWTPLAAGLVLVWAWLSRTDPRDLGLVWPQGWFNGWIGGLVAGTAIGLAEKLLLKAVILPLLGAPAMNPYYQDLADNPRRAIVFAALAIFQAGIAEEIVYRGFLFERLTRLVGGTVLGRSAVVAVTAVIFGAAHWSQGYAGMANAFCVGLMSGALYLACGRRLYVVMVSHAVFDLAALAMIYFGWESAIAHLLFR